MMRMLIYLAVWLIYTQGTASRPVGGSRQRERASPGTPARGGAGRRVAERGAAGAFRGRPMRGGARGGESRQAVVERVRPVVERERGWESIGRGIGGWGGGGGEGEGRGAEGKEDHFGGGPRRRRRQCYVYPRCCGGDEHPLSFTASSSHGPPSPPRPNAKRQTPNAKYQIPNTKF